MTAILGQGVVSQSTVQLFKGFLEVELAMAFSTSKLSSLSAPPIKNILTDAESERNKSISKNLSFIFVSYYIKIILWHLPITINTYLKDYYLRQLSNHTCQCSKSNRWDFT